MNQWGLNTFSNAFLDIC